MHWCVATESRASKFLDLLVFLLKWPDSQANAQMHALPVLNCSFIFLLFMVWQLIKTYKD